MIKRKIALFIISLNIVQDKLNMISIRKLFEEKGFLFQHKFDPDEETVLRELSELKAEGVRYDLIILPRVMISILLKLTENLGYSFNEIIVYDSNVHFPELDKSLLTKYLKEKGLTYVPFVELKDTIFIKLLELVDFCADFN